MVLRYVGLDAIEAQSVAPYGMTLATAVSVPNDVGGTVGGMGVLVFPGGLVGPPGVLVAPPPGVAGVSGLHPHII